jgi:hypothetical protein
MVRTRGFAANPACRAPRPVERVEPIPRAPPSCTAGTDGRTDTKKSGVCSHLCPSIVAARLRGRPAGRATILGGGALQSAAHAESKQAAAEATG